MPNNLVLLFVLWVPFTWHKQTKTQTNTAIADSQSSHCMIDRRFGNTANRLPHLTGTLSERAYHMLRGSAARNMDTHVTSACRTHSSVYGLQRPTAVYGGLRHVAWPCMTDFMSTDTFSEGTHSFIFRAPICTTALGIWTAASVGGGFQKPMHGRYINRSYIKYDMYYIIYYYICYILYNIYSIIKKHRIHAY